MFEFDSYQSQLHEVAALKPRAPYEPVRDVSAMALIFWGEHCVECAAPACFSSCDLYQQRPDLRCRRFVWGMYRNAAVDSLRGYGTEISFKQWGKIEARGNAAMLPAKQVLRVERLARTVAPVINGLGRVMRRLTGNVRYLHMSTSLRDRAGRWLHRRNNGVQPDAFLVELYNPADTETGLQLSMGIDRSELSAEAGDIPMIPPFQATFRLPPGYSRHEFPRESFAHVTGAGLPFNIMLLPESGSEIHVVFLTADFVTYRQAATGTQATVPAIKCVVWDLDNTLWDGILLENDDVAPRQEVIDLLHRLDQRGILLSIASKNDFEYAWERLKMLGLDELFLYPQIGWAQKSEGLRNIASQLNIGIDTFAFIDDNPFELEEVARSLPEVSCINVTDIASIDSDARFRGSDSAEAGKRRSYYQDAIQRTEVQSQFGDDYRAFLASCEIVLQVEDFSADNRGRVEELVQRTNQLNFSGNKYTREDLAPLIDDAGLHKYVLSCSDRYGSYGIVGFSMVRRQGDELAIEDFMLSCRVQGKLIEQAFFAWLVQQEGAAVASLRVNFHATGRNKPAQEVLRSLHFEDCETGKGLCLDLREHSLACDFVEIR